MPIDAVRVGDEVYSLNEETGALELGTVTALFKRTAQSTYRVEVGGGVIETTREHPFYVEDQGWTEAQNLPIGDFVDTLDGFTLPITGIEVVNEPTTVYNFSVNGNHNYYVSEDGVLVHNIACKWSPPPPHGNSHASTQAQHGYEIVDSRTGKVVKTGVSGGKLNKNGSSRRANSQVNEWNNEADEFGNLNTGRYQARVVMQIWSGSGARSRAIGWEKMNANRLRAMGHLQDVLRHVRP